MKHAFHGQVVSLMVLTALQTQAAAPVIYRISSPDSWYCRKLVPDQCLWRQPERYIAV